MLGVLAVVGLIGLGRRGLTILCLACGGSSSSGSGCIFPIETVAAEAVELGASLACKTAWGDPSAYNTSCDAFEAASTHSRAPCLLGLLHCNEEDCQVHHCLPDLRMRLRRAWLRLRSSFATRET